MNMLKNFKEKIGMIVFSTNSKPEINSQANLLWWVNFFKILGDLTWNDPFNDIHPGM